MLKNELTFYDHNRGLEVAKALLAEHYVVMLSLEEELLVVNYEWSHNSDRNDMVFMSRDEYEDEWDTFRDNVYDSIREETIKGLALEGRLK